MNERADAARLLEQILFQGRSLSAVLKGFPATALVREMCYGVLRWHDRLDALLQRLLNRPLKGRDRDIYCLMLVGLYQLTYMRIPDHAAVAETVSAADVLGKHWATALVNGVMRSYLRRQEVLQHDVDRDPSAAMAHPGWLLDKIRHDWPADWQDILHANNRRPPMTLRVNLRCQSRDEYVERLRQVGLASRPHPFAAAALVLDSPVTVEQLPGFATGDVSVQDAAAQLAAPLLLLQPGMDVLDACAAPGGKTIHLLEQQPQLHSLWAVDHDPQRLVRVRQNLERSGQTATLVCADAAAPDDWWDGRLFDRILLDAPCSATGVIRRHPDIKVLRRLADIAALAGKQQAILAALWPMLKPGGRLLYVTCSVLAEENHRQIESFLSRYPAASEENIDTKWGRPLAVGRQILPGDADMDGFYYARLSRSG